MADRQQHIDTLARAMDPTFFGRHGDRARTNQRMARNLFDSTDPAVHDALVAALHANADRARVLAAHADNGWLDSEWTAAGTENDGVEDIEWVAELNAPDRAEAEEFGKAHGGWIERRYVSEWEAP